MMWSLQCWLRRLLPWFRPRRSRRRSECHLLSPKCRRRRSRHQFECYPRSPNCRPCRWRRPWPRFHPCWSCRRRGEPARGTSAGRRHTAHARGPSPGGSAARGRRATTGRRAASCRHNPTRAVRIHPSRSRPQQSWHRPVSSVRRFRWCCRQCCLHPRLPGEVLGDSRNHSQPGMQPAD